MIHGVALLAITVLKDTPLPTTSVAVAIVSLAGMRHPNNKNNTSFTLGNGPSDSLEFNPQVHYAALSATVKSLETKKSASSSPNATYNSESDDDGNEPWYREGWVP